MSAPEAIEFRVLGPLEVRADGDLLPLGSPKQRALLALLLLHANEPLSRDRLIDELWGEAAPASVNSALHVYLSRLRKQVGDQLVRDADGYHLSIEPDRLDATRFVELARRGRDALAAGETAHAADVLGDALALWRGPVLSGLAEPVARAEAGQLAELRLAACEDRFEAELALGHDRALTAELQTLVAEHPYRERLCGQLILALYRSGRQVEALQVYQRARRTLDADLGLEPGPQLRELEQAILRQDEGLTGPEQGARSALAERAPARRPEARRRRRRAALGCGALAAAVALAATVLLTRDGDRVDAAGTSVNSIGLFAPSDGGRTGQIPLQASPSAITSGAGSIWVANVDAHSVSRIDPIRKITIQTVEVGNGPAGIAFGGGFVWVANGLDGTVSKIDPRTNTSVQQIAVGSGPAGVAAGSRLVWVANSSDGTVTPIDVRTGTPRTAIPIGQSADGVAVGFGSVWVTSFSTGSVSRIDLRSMRVVRVIFAGNGAGAVTTGAGAVWVANALDSTVTRIDPETNAVHAGIPVGDGPDGIAVVDGAVWVSNELAGTLSRIDPARNAVVRSVRTGGRPKGVALAAGALAVAARASGLGHRGGTLRVLAPSYAIDTMDPAFEQTNLWLTNDGLTGFRRVGGSAGTRLVPDLAVSLPTPTDAGRSYTFQLRPGIRYSTGALVRPQDIRRAIQRSLALNPGIVVFYGRIVGAQRCVREPRTPCDLSAGIVTDAGSNTVTFHLRAPDPSFLYALALSPAYAVPAGTSSERVARVPATGPYEIASFSLTRGIRFVRNPRFREWSPAAQPSGFPDVIVERYDGSADANVAAVLAGHADLAMEIGQASPGVLVSLRTRHASQLELNPWDATYSLALNTRLPPFDDVRVRRALNLAVDRTHLRDITVGPGLGELTCQVLPPDFDGYARYCPYTARPDASGAWVAPDLAKARRLVRASGTAGMLVTVWTPEWVHYRAAPGRYVASVLRSLGYRARSRTAADPYGAEDRLGIQLGFWGWVPSFASPAGFIPPALTCGAYDPVNAQNGNPAEFCNAPIDREIRRAQALQTSDPQAAARLWARVDRDITDQAPWVAFANGVVLEVVSDRVGNYQYNPQWGTLLDQLWVR